MTEHYGEQITRLLRESPRIKVWCTQSSIQLQEKCLSEQRCYVGAISKTKCWKSCVGWCEYEIARLDDAMSVLLCAAFQKAMCGKAYRQLFWLNHLKIAAQKAQAVYDRGQWPRFFFTKGGKGGIARKTYLDNVWR